MPTPTGAAKAEPAGVTFAVPGELAQPANQNVTPAARKAAATAAERKRRQRERERAADLMFRREDWHLFIDPQNLPQKAGCHPNDLMKLVLKELVDNALDAGANVSITRGENDWWSRHAAGCLSLKSISLAASPKSSRMKRSLSPQE